MIVDKFTAITNCTDVKITQIQINGPIGLKFSNMTQQSTNTWYMNTTWQPTVNQLGYNLICTLAVDSTFLRALECITIYVVNSNPLQVISNYPKNIIDLNLLVYESYLLDYQLTFALSFNHFNITKPFISSFIRIYSYSTNKEILKYDTSLMNTNDNVNILDNNLIFKLPIDLIQMNEWYYILFDYGVVIVNNSCVISSDSVNDTTFWRFKVLNIIPTTPLPTTTTTTALTTTTTAPLNYNCNKTSFVLTLVIFLVTFILINALTILVVIRYGTIKL